MSGRALARLGTRSWFTEIGRRAAHHVDRAIFALTGRTLAEAFRPALLLETRGRRSGRMRRSPLLYVRDGDAFVVIASAWGQRAHPDWSANLLAHPDATATIDRHAIRVRASLVSGAERERLWRRMRELWPGYDRYRDSAGGRRIRVFLLRPLG